MGETRVEQLMEQAYFDLAWEERERSRAVLQGAHKGGANQKVASAIGRQARRHLDAMGSPDEEVAFGRVDKDGEHVYIGKRMISNAERDLLVINWQMDAAAPFYKASAKKPLGVDRIRKFKTKKNSIQSFQDLVFADIAKRVDELTRHEALGIDDVLLDDLDRGRDGAMRDIVQTIHHAQDSLIRTPLDRLIVIQGGPGTGKTVVALHRVSWLLFQHRRDLSPEQILVIGPSRTFSQYISQVLPGLGDDGVANATLRSLGPQQSDDRVEPIEVARLKGQAKMAGLIQRALDRRIRFPRAENAILVGSGAAAARFSRGEVEQQITRLRSLGTYNTGRQGLRAWLQAQAPQRTNSTTVVTPTNIDSALDRVWPQLTAQSFLRELLGSRPQIGDAAGDDFTAGDIGRLYRTSADKLANETWSHADVALLDEANVLLNGAGPGYSHIVVDEAQDLSPMQLRSIARRSTNNSFTIVGDIAQSTGPWARDSWQDVVDSLEADTKVQIEELEYGYRVPRQIFEFAAQLLAHAAPSVTPPRVVREGPSVPELRHMPPSAVATTAVERAQHYAGKGLFVGIICSPQDHDRLAEALSDADVTYDDASGGRLGKSINLMTAEQAKGLEFEAAVVVEPATIAGGTTTGLRLLYVALTRTTKHLTVAYNEGFPLLGLEGTGRGPNQLVSDMTSLGPDNSALGGILSPARTRSPSASLAAAETTKQATRARRSVAQVIAAELGHEIKGQLQPERWPELIDALREELGL